MKKLSEYRDLEALELLADLIGPVTRILTDKDVVNTFRRNKLEGVQKAIKGHAKSVFKCMAVLEGKSVEEYHCNIVTLPRTILEILNDKELIDFFNLQSQQVDEELSGSAMETGKVEKA